MQGSEKRFLTIPNLLSLVRIAMVPLFVWCFFHRPGAVAIGIFLAAGATDVVDGYIARRWNQITVWGRVLDPMADKLMVFAALLCLTAAGTIPLWLVLLYFAKETAQAVCGMLLMRRIKDMPPSNLLGKAGTCLFYVTIVVLTLLEPAPAVKNTLLALSYGTVLAAFFSYVLRGLRLSRNQQNNQSED